jgi:hypothetical protein
MFMAYEPELPAFAASGRHKLRDCDWTGSYHCAVGTAASTIPSPCPDGGDLRTLRDAGDFIAGLPKREHDTFAWRAAIQALMLVAEHGGDTMLPRIGIMRALYPGGMAPTPRRKRKRSRRSATGSFDEDGASMMVTSLPRHRTTMCGDFESSHRCRTRSTYIARRW